MFQFRLSPVYLVVLVSSITSSAFGSVQIKQDALHQTIGISSLTNNDLGCGPVSFTGKIAKRVFADDAMTVSGLVIEGQDGTRTYINVYIPANLDRFTQGAVSNGLQRLLKEGRNVTGEAQACGSGPVLTLKQIQ